MNVKDEEKVKDMLTIFAGVITTLLQDLKDSEGSEGIDKEQFDKLTQHISKIEDGVRAL